MKVGRAGKLVVLATVVILSSVIFGQQEIKPSGPKRRYYSKTYTVLSANVGNSNPLEEERKYKLHDDLVPRVKEEIQRLKPDILILLEVANENQIKDICTNSEGQLEYWIYGESYNFLCIRKNIGEVINFQQTSADNKALHIGYLDLMLKNEDIPRKVRLFFVYLPSFLAVGKERKNELDIWGFDWIVKNLPTDSPCLIAGDFNLDFIRDRKNPAAKFIYEKVKDLNLWIFNPLKDPLTTPDGSVNAEYEATYRPTDLVSDQTIDWVMGKGAVPLFQVPHKDPLKLDIFIPHETTSSLSTPPVLNLPLSDRPLKSFVTSPSDWWREISPLTFDHKPLYGEVVFVWEEIGEEPIGLAVVIDRSVSMTGEKLAQAKRVADGLFAFLNSNDFACLISFARSSRIEVGLVQATPENKNQLQAKVKSLEADNPTGSVDSTNITVGLNTAFYELMKANTSKRAVYLLSDGMHNTGLSPLESLSPISHGLSHFVLYSIPIDTVAYGQGSDPYAGVDLEMLKKIAQLTGGTFYDSPQQLEKILEGFRVGSTSKEHKIGDFIFPLPAGWKFILPQESGLCAVSTLDPKDKTFLNLIVGVRTLPDFQKEAETGKWRVVHYGFEGGKKIEEAGKISKTMSVCHPGYLIDSFKTKMAGRSLTVCILRLKGQETPKEGEKEIEFFNLSTALFEKGKHYMIILQGRDLNYQKEILEQLLSKVRLAN